VRSGYPTLSGVDGGLYRQLAALSGLAAVTGAGCRLAAAAQE
jgi:hypothetical protein